jgi:NADH-quinone oxidoreductase subunit J
VTLYAFYFLSFLAVMGALMVVFSRNPVASVIFLVMTFFTIACHYMLLNAQFLAAVHVIVYAGAIMVLFLYVIMLLNLNEAVEKQKTLLLKVAAIVTGGLFMIVLSAALRTAETSYIDTSVVGSARNLGKVLLNEYLLPFEAVSLLLLAAMTGAIMLARSRKRIKPAPNVVGMTHEREQTKTVVHEQ